MKRPQYVFRPNLSDPQHRRAWALLQQMPSANLWATTYRQDNDTPALNALKALRGAPISMGRGEIPVELCQQPSVLPISFYTNVSERGITV